MAFNLNALAPATSFEVLGKSETAKSSKQIAIDNVDAQIALIDPKAEGKRTFWDTGLGGKRSYTGDGKYVGFYLKVGSAKLMIGKTQEIGVEKEKFKETLEGLKAAIAKGDLNKELAALDTAKAARTDKLRATRAAKKTG